MKALSKKIPRKPTETELVAEAQPIRNGAHRLVRLDSSLEERLLDARLRVVFDLLQPLGARFLKL